MVVVIREAGLLRSCVGVGGNVFVTWWWWWWLRLYSLSLCQLGQLRTLSPTSSSSVSPVLDSQTPAEERWADAEWNLGSAV